MVKILEKTNTKNYFHSSIKGEKVMPKFLRFCCHGEWFSVNEKSEMTQSTENPKFSGKWKLLGVSYHYRRQYIDCYFEELFKDPKLMINGRIWDLDHGTTRKWSGRHMGKLPRVTQAYMR